MSKAYSEILAACLRQISGKLRSDARTDAELLNSFITSRDELAFSILVGRHALQVWGSCRTVLNATPDAEDAFQATFLILARKAKSVRPESMAGWLQKVSRRVSLDCRRSTLRRMRREGKVLPPPAGLLVDSNVANSEEELAVWEELSNLPERYRIPLILYYLEGKTQAEVGRVLGVTDRAISQRIDRAIRALRDRLSLRGLSVTSIVMATMLERVASAQVVPLGLVSKATAVAVSGKAATASVMILVSQATSKSLMIAKASLAAVAVTVGVAWVGLAASPVTEPTRPLSQKSAPLTDLPAKAERVPDATDQPLAVLTGVIRDDAGRPVSMASIVVMTKSWQRGSSTSWDSVVANGQADLDGRFRIAVPPFVDPIDADQTVRVVASDPEMRSRTVRTISLLRGRHPAELSIRLGQPTGVKGTVLDQAGHPLSGASIRVTRIDGASVDPSQEPGKLAGCWPSGVISGKDGTFEVASVDPGAGTRITVERDGFSPQEIVCEGSAIRIALNPARRLTGRVVDLDTGEPIANSRLVVFSDPATHLAARRDVLADSHGNFSIVVPDRGKIIGLHAHPPEGSAYLSVAAGESWPAGHMEVSTTIKLPRGVILRGKVVDSENGRPVPRPRVQFVSRREGNPLYRAELLVGGTGLMIGGEDGSFALAVPRGPGTLVVTGPNLDYLPIGTDVGTLDNGKSGGRRVFAHAIEPITDAGADPAQRTVKLSRGRSIEGQATLPDGTPLADGLVLCRHFTTARNLKLPTPLSVVDGRFAVPGCQPGCTYTVLLADPAFRYAAVAKIECTSDDKVRVAVRLEPCGRLRLTVRDQDGIPLAGVEVRLYFQLPSDVSQDQKSDEPLPSQDLLPSQWWQPALPDMARPVMRTDADGRVDFCGLVPGLRYHLGVVGDSVLLLPAVVATPDRTIETTATIRDRKQP